MRVYVPYWMWEDYHNGMWRKVKNETYWLNRSIKFTSDHVQYGEAMRQVVKEWPYTMINSLTNPSINKLAFIGHCACSMACNLPEYLVRQAWKKLEDYQRDLANQEAECALRIWKTNEEKVIRIYQRMGTQMLLQWNTGQQPPRDRRQSPQL